MHNFFKGWKRKAGVATLGFACVATREWIREIQLNLWLGIPLTGGLYWNFATVSIESTILSAYLLLSKPRPPKAVPIIMGMGGVFLVAGAIHPVVLIAGILLVGTGGIVRLLEPKSS